MASNTVFFCKECGYESAKWLGKCPGCNSWNSFVEEKINKKNTSKTTCSHLSTFSKTSTVKKLKDIKSKKIIIATVGLADPKNEKNIKNIKNHMKKQLDEDIFKNAKIFHLRGAIDYSKLGFIYKTMMKALIIKIKRTSNDKKTSEDTMILETYNKKVDFVDLSSLNEILNEIIL